ncbi:MAG: hypothetical protein U0T73_09655 [Chitinophagales bacterium]
MISELREMLLSEHSKAQKERITAWIGNDQKRFDALIQLFLGAEYRITQRAAWPLSEIAINCPWLVSRHLSELVGTLSHHKAHPAVRRNVLRLFQFVPVPENLQGEMLERCFSFLQSADQPIAIKVFSMEVASHICRQHPDLIPELTELITGQVDFSGPGFKSRARKVLADLKKYKR